MGRHTSAEQGRAGTDASRTSSRVALITQIYLQQSQTELATKEVNMARQWAQDSVLVNLAEAWVGLRVVSGQRSRASISLVISRTAYTETSAYRAGRSINRHTTSSRSLRRRLRRRRTRPWSARPSPSCILGDCRKPRLRWSRQRATTGAMHSCWRTPSSARPSRGRTRPKRSRTCSCAV